MTKSMLCQRKSHQTEQVVLVYSLASSSSMMM